MRCTFFLLSLLLFFGCSTHSILEQECKGKVSSKVSSFLHSESSELETLEISIVLTDTTGLRSEFPEISFPFATIGLGKCTKETIRKLCNHHAIRYIDVSKTFKPLNKKPSGAR